MFVRLSVYPCNRNKAPKYDSNLRELRTVVYIVLGVTTLDIAHIYIPI